MFSCWKKGGALCGVTCGTETSKADKRLFCFYHLYFLTLTMRDPLAYPLQLPQYEQLSAA